MENTYRDTNIALANKLAMVCESLGIDALKAIKAANHHPRVNIHTPGPGVGGHCLSIDPYFIVDIAEKEGVKTPLINNSRLINESMPEHVSQIVQGALKEVGKPITGSKIGLLGVAYKGDVADARETPAKPLIRLLIKKGASVYVHDPYISPQIIRPANPRSKRATCASFHLRDYGASRSHGQNLNRRPGLDTFCVPPGT